MRKNRKMPPKMFARYEPRLRRYVRWCADMVAGEDRDFAQELVQVGRIAIWRVSRERLRRRKAKIAYLRRAVLYRMLAAWRSRIRTEAREVSMDEGIRLW